MARIKIEFPEVHCFDTKYIIAIGDINYGGHLANDAVLRIVHEARIRFLENYSMSEIKVGTCGLIMYDAAIQYLAEAFRGEQILIRIAIDSITKFGFDLLYELMNEKGKEVARVKTGMLFFDYSKHKLAAESEETLVKLKSIAQ
jgi:acyl-CoA thioester hydrolase